MKGTTFSIDADLSFFSGKKKEPEGHLCRISEAE
jgi:hypothetical protein